MKKERILLEDEAEKILSKYAPIAKSQIIKSPEELKLPLPIVLKIISPKALHKTEIQGVKTVDSKEQLESQFQALEKIAKRKKLSPYKILAQEKLSGTQFIIGIKKDPTFNHVILVGLGGVFTEILKDTSIRKCPISKNDAEEMLSTLQAKEIFNNFRNKKLNSSLLVDALIKISQVPAKYPEIEQLDINPFILSNKQGKVADARIILN